MLCNVFLKVRTFEKKVNHHNEISQIKLVQYFPNCSIFHFFPIWSNLVKIWSNLVKTWFHQISPDLTRFFFVIFFKTKQTWQESFWLKTQTSQYPVSSHGESNERPALAKRERSCNESQALQKGCSKGQNILQKAWGWIEKIHWQKAEQTKPGEIGSDDPAREIEKSWWRRNHRGCKSCAPRADDQRRKK